MSYAPNKADVFRLTISRNELIASSRLWGLPELLLPNEMQHTGQTLDSINYDAGLDSLRNHGLVRQVSKAKWVLDNLVVFVLGVLNNPEAILLVNIFNRAKNRSVYVYATQEIRLPILVEGERYHFYFYKEYDEIPRWLLGWIDREISGLLPHACVDAGINWAVADADLDAEQSSFPIVELVCMLNDDSVGTERKKNRLVFHVREESKVKLRPVMGDNTKPGLNDLLAESLVKLFTALPQLV
jgi:hypothetical protein